MADVKRLFNSGDMAGAILYAKRLAGDTEDAYPLLSDTNGALLISGNISVSASGTESTINNAVGNPVNVALTSTAVTVTGTVSLNTTAVTASLSNTGVTVNNAIGAPVNVALTSTAVTAAFSNTRVTVDIALTSTVVTVKSAVAGFNVNIATATLGTVAVSLTSTVVTTAGGSIGTITGSVTPGTGQFNLGKSEDLASASGDVGIMALAKRLDVPVANANVTNDADYLPLITDNFGRVWVNPIGGRTMTGSTGSLSATYGTISITPTTRAKVYAFSLTTTSATEVTAIFCTGPFTNSMELWRVTLMAPAGTNAGANLAVSPPSHLFSSRSGTAVSLSLSSAVLVHYSISYFDEA